MPDALTGDAGPSRLVEELQGAPGLPGPDPRQSPANLTARELEVLRHVASGMSSREIANILHMPGSRAPGAT